MQVFATGLFSEMESTLNSIERSELPQIRKTAAAVESSRQYINTLRSFVYKYKFKKPAEEIAFFKEIKPSYLSVHIYYVSLFSIETKMPLGGEKATRKYCQREMEKLKVFFNEHADFYRYVRTGSTYLDHKYFLRNNKDIDFIAYTFFVDTDPKFSTGYDYLLAKILANEKLQQYLENKIIAIQQPPSQPISQGHPKPMLQWTESKAALVELIYALHTQYAIDKGRAGVREIAACFENMFNISLGDYYRSFLEIRMRKSGRTKFIDNLRENLLRKMDQMDE